jgi:hypothetical protein
VLEHPVVQPGARPGLDLRPHLVAGQVPVVLAPAAVVANERGGLEGEHPVSHRPAVAHHAGDLIQVGRGHGHVVGQEIADAVLAAQPGEHRGEPGPVGVQ